MTTASVGRASELGNSQNGLSVSLNHVLYKELYMEQPQGLSLPDRRTRSAVLRQFMVSNQTQSFMCVTNIRGMTS